MTRLCGDAAMPGAVNTVVFRDGTAPVTTSTGSVSPRAFA